VSGEWSVVSEYRIFRVIAHHWHCTQNVPALDYHYPV